MNIKILIERSENADFFGVQINDIVEVDYEQYVAAVVASEIGNASIEACKAQAIAARTYAAQKVFSNKPISDLSTKAQAYRAKRYNQTTYPNAIQGTLETQGIIITYEGKPINAVYSANNGGRTVSSKERWGGSGRPYLIAQDDPWDKAAGSGKTGHGVGMSQRGAKYAAKMGKNFEEILSFYYPNTILCSNYGVDKMIQTKELIALFHQALNEKWGYIYGTAGEKWTQAKQSELEKKYKADPVNYSYLKMGASYGSKWINQTVSDCSGLFTWAFKKLGGYMYHGSNTMYKQYCTSKGKLTKGKKQDGTSLKPGTAVFLWNQEEGYHHVGLFIGNNTVIEAKGTQYGVVTSKVTAWDCWGELKGVSYDTDEKEVVVVMKYAKVPNATLNLRKGPSKNDARLLGIPAGATVQVIEETNSEWWKVIYNGTTGYVMQKYLTVIENKTVTLSENDALYIWEVIGKALGK